MPIIKKSLVPIFLAGALLFSFWFGILVGENKVVCQVCSPEKVNFSLFWEAWNILEEDYANPEALNVQEMIYGAISGMIKSLEDPHTIFFKPEDAKKFLEDTSGKFEGVGMEIGIRQEKLQVIAPLENTPAQRAGLRPGDRILKIDDTLTINITIDEAVTLIRGPKGTEVILSILRNEWEESKDFTITRAVINIPSLKWELLDSTGENEGEAGDIIYLKLYHFSRKINDDFARASIEILKTPAKKIILDLRNNPGGYLEKSQDIAGWFLKKGEVVVIEDFGKGEEQEIYKAKGNAKFADYPMVILINQGSASASEILASALRDNRGIKIIGETSFGKGSVQQLKELRDGSSLKVTIANWLTPNGELITDIGLKPDIEVEMTEEDYEQERDPQLDKAIEVIREME